jgi:prepilin-type N-terminal cleavage/methylation domain-containing protein/prepilin-type processing-associated H-X9-DG protein
MKKLSSSEAARAFTLLELAIVVAVVAILAAMLLPTSSGPSRAYRVVCLSNLKQQGIGLILWASDHGGRFPAQVSVTNDGSMELTSGGSPAPHYQALREMRLNPQLLVCPTDKSRLRANSFVPPLTDHNISYFLSVDATPTATNTILAGDRHLEVAGKPPKPGLLVLTTQAAANWTHELHYKSGPTPGGNLLFIDGHAAWHGKNVSTVIQGQSLATNHLAFP